MAYTGLKDFIAELDRKGDLHRINVFVDPLLEIAEITDRITKSGGKALLFENNGTHFPVLINAFGSEKRMHITFGGSDINEVAKEIGDIFERITSSSTGISGKLRLMPRLVSLARYLPEKKRSAGLCQQIIHKDPDLSILPVLKCWPHDGGRFITLPVVHTFNPETGSTNAGMYRIQILGKSRAAMHWQRHKTGANHFEAWKKSGKRMPVSVTLGGDPAYTYSATAPLPENVSEYILAGFLRKKKVKLVKCVTNDIYVPEDADIVIEGYVDPEEDFISEGPFGDHTGFYSLADYYPVFHVTCITHSKNAVYPATVVGIPPHEDAWLTGATEKIFFTPVKIALQPEIEDFHMPPAGVAHNLLVVKIRKTYPGQGLKVISALLGAGQMMFTKYLVAVSGEVNIRNYDELIRHISEHTDINSDVVFTKGPLDVLDHSSDTFSFGGKAGIDSTIKLPEEIHKNGIMPDTGKTLALKDIDDLLSVPFIRKFSTDLIQSGINVLIIAVNPSEDPGSVRKVADLLQKNDLAGFTGLVVAVDHTVDVHDLFTVTWQALGNSDPMRDRILIPNSAILIDGTIKYYRKDGFRRLWPNVVCSDAGTIKIVDEKWSSLGFKDFIPSPSLKYNSLVRNGYDHITD
jgi:4-hydroxy-3-polyprenylbenzoate decarboxylase